MSGSTAPPTDSGGKVVALPPRGRTAAPAAPLEGFEAMGWPIPEARREAAYRAVKVMVPDAKNSQAWELVERVAGPLERDQPYVAQREAMKGGGLCLDATGMYRLLACLLSGPIA